ncbi:MAG: hypothetical protein FJ297_01165 [Planctomycetes bacterium]|nr:hypothetical protein [Planctomycetota bacterium]
MMMPLVAARIATPQLGTVGKNGASTHSARLAHGTARAFPRSSEPTETLLDPELGTTARAQRERPGLPLALAPALTLTSAPADPPVDGPAPQDPHPTHSKSDDGTIVPRDGESSNAGGPNADGPNAGSKDDGAKDGDSASEGAAIVRLVDEPPANITETPSDGADANRARPANGPLSGSPSSSTEADDPSSLERETNRSPERPLTAEQEVRREKIRDVLAYHIQRHEQVERRSPWGIMHALIAYGVDTQVFAGDRKVNAIGWLCYNGPCRGQQLLYLENDQLMTRLGPGVQGHGGQFLAMLAQSKVKADFPIRVEGESLTVMDLVKHEMSTCQEGTELTFKLIGLSHYLESDAQWKNTDGQAWDIPKLIKEELAQPVIGAACGGTHRMMGFSYSVKRREKSELPIAGQWLRARKYVDAYHDYTFKLQNADGSFSTNWFRGPGEYGTNDRHLETTGHTCEWLAFSLSDDQLQDPRMVKAVDFLASMLHDNLDHEWEIGPKGHALHALAIYDERVYGGQPGKRGIELAEHRKQKKPR